MDEDVEIKLFLDLDHILDLLLDEFVILVCGDFSLCELVARDPNFRCLGEGANGGCWEHG